MDSRNTTTLRAKLALWLAVAAMSALTMFTAEAKAQAVGESLPQVSAVVEPLRPGVTEDQVLTELANHSQRRTAALHDYISLRTYQVADVAGKVHAEEIGRMEYIAPDKKTFTITSEAGSGMVRYMALNPLIRSEIDAAIDKQHHDSTISAENYSLNLLGEQQVGSYRCFVAAAAPKRKDKYLFEGKLWIDAVDYSVVRIEGHPAKKLSFWIQGADFVRQYQKIDGFWLPQRDETLVQVRLYGKKVLTIEHHDYVVNGGLNKEARAIVPVAALPTEAHIN
jgi:hypothetical protein